LRMGAAGSWSATSHWSWQPVFEAPEGSQRSYVRMGYPLECSDYIPRRRHAVLVGAETQLAPGTILRTDGDRLYRDIDREVKRAQASSSANQRSNSCQVAG
jgi:hypothetical protein